MNDVDVSPGITVHMTPLIKRLRIHKQHIHPLLKEWQYWQKRHKFTKKLIEQPKEMRKTIM
jgi:hypothetical protein